VNLKIFDYNRQKQSKEKKCKKEIY